MSLRYDNIYLCSWMTHASLVAFLIYSVFLELVCRIFHNVQGYMLKYALELVPDIFFKVCSDCGHLFSPWTSLIYKGDNFFHLLYTVQNTGLLLQWSFKKTDFAPQPESKRMSFLGSMFFSVHIDSNWQGWLKYVWQVASLASVSIAPK